MSLCSSNVTSGFIDLATFDELEKYLYGGQSAITYFVRQVRKSTWFTQIPVPLAAASGTAAFNQEHSVLISRAGDYLLGAWLRVTFPAITISTAIGANDGSLRWTRNLMHNLIQECCLTVNDLVVARLDNYHLDFWAAFTTPAGKRNGYLNMIGDIDDLQGVHVSGSANTTIPSATLNLPLPFFFSRDTSVAIPTAALPYNELRLQFTFRNWTDLLIYDDFTVAAGNNPSRAATVADIEGGVAPTITAAQVWGNYAIVANDERKRMGCGHRDILIEQVQTAPRQTFNPSNNRTPSYDIRFSHAIKALFFAVRNSTTAPQWSNYTAGSPVPSTATVNFNPGSSVDPIQETSLIYESTQRLASMGSDYFSLVAPWYHAPVIPVETGFHMYSYSLDFIALDPKGSTNYGKLTNVSVVFSASDGAVAGSAGTGTAGDGADYAQSYVAIVTAVNNNILRISGGSAGFPVL